MESLSDLPLEDEDRKLSQKDKEIMHKNIGGGAPSKKSKKSDDSEGVWRKIGYIIIAFAVLANPWVSGLLSKIPYIGGNSITEFIFALVIFTIAVAVIEFYG